MPCPYFQPTGPIADSEWSTPARMPLGDLCTGLCRAGDDLFIPDNETLRICNRGYARSVCARFPEAATSDAVRFSVTADQGGALEIIYIYELNYAPVRHGVLKFDPLSLECWSEFDDPVVRAQARMFVESWMRRKLKPVETPHEQ